MNLEVKEKLKELADKYENKDFLKNDPSKYMHLFSEARNQEIVAFISANLAFGKRSQILNHIEIILESAKENPEEWILCDGYKKLFPESDASFYRVYSFKDMLLFFDGIKKILVEEGSLGKAFEKKYFWHLKNNSLNEKIYLSKIIPSFFDKKCKLLAHGKNSAAKKLNMFLRWMVRDNSPVDLGLWSSWYKKSDLLIPLDTHVLQEAVKLQLLKTSAPGKKINADFKSALALTQELNLAFPGDPARGDYALFGLGVDGQE